MGDPRFAHPPPAQYSAEEPDRFIQFINYIYEDGAVALAVKHVDFCRPASSDHTGSYPVEELYDFVRIGKPGDHRRSEIFFKRDLNEKAKRGLQNVFDAIFFHPQWQPETGRLDELPPHELLLLHVLAVLPCKNITLLTVPRKWYARVTANVKRDLEADLPLVNFSIKTRVENRDAVRIGGPEAYEDDDHEMIVESSSAQPEEPHEEAFMPGPVVSAPIASGHIVAATIARNNINTLPEALSQHHASNIQGDEGVMANSNRRKTIDSELIDPRLLGTAPAQLGVAPPTSFAPVRTPEPEISPFSRPPALEPPVSPSQMAASQNPLTPKRATRHMPYAPADDSLLPSPRTMQPGTYGTVPNVPAGLGLASGTTLPPAPMPSHLPQPANNAGPVGSDTAASPSSDLPSTDDFYRRPRCQPCLKAKKGCNRARPCNRCEQAGRGWEECEPEPEAKASRGYYGAGPGRWTQNMGERSVRGSGSGAGGARPTA